MILFMTALCLLLLTGARIGDAAELVIFESDSCEWCELWHEEIGVVYAKTAEARIAPLRRVSIEDPVPGDLEHVRGIHYTPTFVLMEDGEEVGRILGYPGEDFFWGLLGMELEKLKSEMPGEKAQANASGCLENEHREHGEEETGDSTFNC
jgi:thioredoxin-related protein